MGVHLELPVTTTSPLAVGAIESAKMRILCLVSENPVIIFSRRPPPPPPLCCVRRVNEALALLTFDVTSSHGHLLSQPFVIVPAVFTGGARASRPWRGLVAFPTQRPPRLSSGWR
ncbi:hypothetical protein CK203_033604 [Vitis vinifera]|uniref:Uncharacterized protein n=1 Tax=Vitis vinifera TaxID=29760 RepID=A0A438FLA2_VITVI|nr:hypothetical protein CK203_033604 [Vitis vinifera]